MDASHFKRIVHASARQAGGKLIALHEPGVAPNFFAAEVALPQASVFVLCSVEGAWACSRSMAYRALDFVDWPALAQALGDGFGIAPLAKAVLDGPFERQPWMAEADIRYWRPQTLGEGLFNWWD